MLVGLLSLFVVVSHGMSFGGGLMISFFCRLGYLKLMISVAGLGKDWGWLRVVGFPHQSHCRM